MFPSGFPSFEPRQEPQGCGCFERWRRWCHRQTQRLREFFRRRRRSSTWDNGWRRRREEKDIPHTPVVIRKQPKTANGGLQGFKAERASALRKNRICPTTPSRRELLEQQVEELVPALLRLDNLFLFEFLNVLEEYGTPEEVLDLLFAKYRYIIHTCKKEGILDQWEIAMSSFLTIWLDYYEEDFHDPPEFPALTKLLKFTGQYVPGSVLDCRVERYLWRFINLHQAEFEGGDDTVSSDPEKHHEPPQERARAPTLGPAPPSGSQGMELVLADAAEGSAQALMPAAAYKVRHVMVRPLHPCPDPEEPPAPLGALEAERAPPPVIEVIDVPEQPPHSGEQPASDPEQHQEPPQQEPTRGRLWGLLKLLGLR
ncbi:ral guanine nucleotide dissociation stimulator-like [Canis lupus dingo]|uniref:ral guanine nucleotide dissociation stimulator-like n=1 Tax=Canis lupus dingo TaxID=286419 RepID=UPI0020C473F0|nr:ral guanine nucleotide dissociation stimulator-like [Canis lupus dingo]